MIPLTALWLPILLSAVIVFVASSIIHMVLPYHKSDYRQLPDEDKVRSTLRPLELKPGVYHFPYCTHKDMKSAATIEKFKEGPVGLLTIFPTGPVNMPKYLVQWFVYCLLVGFFVAYLTGHMISPYAPYRHVFRAAGTAAFMSYGLANLVSSIWKGDPWSTSIKHVIDGLIYAMLTAGTFGWLWPR